MSLSVMDDAIDYLQDHLLAQEGDQAQIRSFLINWRHFQYDNDYINDWLATYRRVPELTKVQTDYKTLCEITEKVLELSLEDENMTCFANFLFNLIFALIDVSIKNKSELLSSSRFLQILIHHWDKSSNLVVVSELIIQLAPYCKLDYGDLALLTKFDDLMSRILIHENVMSSSIVMDHSQKLELDGLTLENRAKGFTLSTWLRFKPNSTRIALSPASCEIITLLVSDKKSVSLEIEGSKLTLVADSQKTVFDCFNLELNVLYHITITYFNSKCNLFINGSSLQCKAISDIFKNSSEAGKVGFFSSLKSLKKSTTPLKLSLTVAGPSEDSDVLLELGNLSLINKVSEILPAAVYLMGPNYSGSFQDLNFTYILPPRKLIQLSVMTNNILKKRKMDLACLEKNEIICCMSMLNFDSARCGTRYQYYHPEKSTLNYGFISGQNFDIHLQRELISCINSTIGCFGLLKLIEDCCTTKNLYSSIKNLFFILENDGTIMNEFIKNFGYDILKIILKSKRELLSLDILDLILEYVGYNSMSPMDSIILDGSAYKSLIIDFDIWCFSTQGSDAILKFVLFQLTVFGQDSKYQSFNIRKINEIKAIKQMIMALNRNRITIESTYDELKSVVFILVSCQSSTKVIKLLLRYITFSMVKYEQTNALEQKRTSTRGAEMILEVLVAIISNKHKDSQLVSEIYLSLHWKWVLGLLQTKSATIKFLALKLFINFIAIQTPSYLVGYTNSGGYDILSNSMIECWNDNKIKNLLFASSFSIIKTSNEPLAIFFNQHKLSFGSNKKFNPEMINVLMIVMTFCGLNMLNNNTEDFAQRLVVLEDFIDFLTNLNDENIEFGQEFTKNCYWVKLLCDISIVLQRSGNSELLRKYTQLIEEIIIPKIFSSEVDYKFIDIFYDKYPSEFNRIVLPLIMDHFSNFQSTISNWIGNNSQVFILRLFHSYIKQQHDNLPVILQLKNLQVIGLVLSKCADKSSEVFAKNSMLTKVVNQFCTEFVHLFLGSHNYDYESEFVERLLEIFMSYSIMIKDNLTKDELVLFFCYLCTELMNKNLNYSLHSLISNCLRVILMDQEDYGSFYKNIFLDDETEVQNLNDILSQMVHVSDEQILQLMQTNGKTILRFKEYLSEHSVNASITSMDLETLEKDCGDIKLQLNLSLYDEIASFNNKIYHIEIKKINDYYQDYEDDLDYFGKFYHLGLSNLVQSRDECVYSLDNTEGKYRQRNILRKIPSCDGSPVTPKKEVKVHKAQSDTIDFSSAASEHTFTSTSADDSLDDLEDDKNRRLLRNLIVHDTIVEIFNVVRILGLESIESIMVLGMNNLYLVENYFVNPNGGNIVSINEAPNDLRDQFVKILNEVTETKTTMSNATANEVNTLKNNHSAKRWSLNKLIAVSKRKFLLRDVAMEVFFMDGSSILITLINTKMRNKVFNKLNSKVNINNHEVDINLNEALHIASNQKVKSVSNNETFKGLQIMENLWTGPIGDVGFSEITKRWTQGEISNFYYLMLINTIAGRTFNDLTQYPVFPFILKDYDSAELDLSNEEIFRDLSKPMGAQSEERELLLKERYEASKEMGEPNPFHYGTHYSSAMIVTSYLIRMNPFTESYLKLQGGKFDRADRLFNNLGKVWKSATSLSTDVRELIPEFYYIGDFLKNSNGLKLGITQEGQEVDDVQLPAWSNGDPLRFIYIMREALESDYVSEHLNEWIDLVFGFKQQGKEAFEATNVFHDYSYSGNVNLENVEDDHERAVITSIIHNFGQTPLKIFQKPHPQKTVFSPAIEEYFGKTFKCQMDYNENTFNVVDEITWDKFNSRWVLLPRGVSILIKDEFSNMKIVTQPGEHSIIINDKYRFEQFDKIECTGIISNGRFTVGFSNGTVKLYELNNDIFKNVTNIRRDSILYDQRVIMELSSSKKGAQPGVFVNELICLRSGQSQSVTKMRYMKYENLLVTLDSRRCELVIWKLVEDELNEIRRIRVENRVRDFDVSNEYSTITTLDGSDRVQIWSVNGMLQNTFECMAGSACVSCLERIDSDYKRGSDLLCIGTDQGSVGIYNSSGAVLVSVETELSGILCARMVLDGRIKISAAGPEGKWVHLE